MNFACSILFLSTMLVNAFSYSPHELSHLCSYEQRKEFQECEPAAHYDWDIQDVDIVNSVFDPNDNYLFNNIVYSLQNIDSRKFCCYAWDTLNCESNVARQCDRAYADWLESQKIQLYGAICEYYYRYSIACSLRWWSLSLIIIAFIAFVALISFIFYRKRLSRQSRQYNTCPK